MVGLSSEEKQYIQYRRIFIDGSHHFMDDWRYSDDNHKYHIYCLFNFENMNSFEYPDLIKGLRSLNN